MRYVEFDRDSRKAYEVTLDTEHLKRIVQLIDLYCSVYKYGVREIVALSEEDAKEKIEESRDNSGFKENKAYKILSIYKDPNHYSESLIKCVYEAMYSSSVELVDIILNLISVNNKDEVSDFESNRKLLIAFQRYQYSKDFIPFIERVNLANRKLQQDVTLSNNDLLAALKEYQDAVMEEKLNKCFDFAKLKELYKEAEKCITISLAEEVRIYRRRQKE